MADEGDGKNPFLKHREELVKNARLERERVDTEAEQEQQRLHKEAEQERQRLAQLRKENLSNAKKYLVEDVELVLENLAENPLILEKAGSKSFTSEAFENFREDTSPIYHKKLEVYVTYDALGVISISRLETNNVLKEIDTSNDDVLLTNPIRALAVSHDCRYLAIDSIVGIQIWDVRSSEKVNTLEGYTSPFAFFPDSYDILVTGIGYLAIFSVTDGQKYEGSTPPFTRRSVPYHGKLSISSVGRTIYLIKCDNIIGDSILHFGLNANYDVTSSGQISSKPVNHGLPIDEIKSFQRIYGYIQGGAIHVKAPKGSLVKSRRYVCENGSFESFSVHPDEGLMVSCSDTGTLILWDIVSKDKIKTRVSSLVGTDFKIDYSSCGNFICLSAYHSEANFGYSTMVFDSALEGRPFIKPENRFRSFTKPIFTQYNGFEDNDLQSIFVNVKDDLREADFILDTVDGINYSLSWSGLS